MMDYLQYIDLALVTKAFGIFILAVLIYILFKDEYSIDDKDYEIKELNRVIDLLIKEKFDLTQELYNQKQQNKNLMRVVELLGDSEGALN